MQHPNRVKCPFFCCKTYFLRLKMHFFAKISSFIRKKPIIAAENSVKSHDIYIFLANYLVMSKKAVPLQPLSSEEARLSEIALRFEAAHSSSSYRHKHFVGLRR